MSEEVWRVQTKLVGNFRLPEHGRLDRRGPLVDGLKSLALAAAFDQEQKWMGFHLLEAEIAVDSEAAGDEPPLVLVYQRARDLVHALVAIISFGAGQCVHTDGGFTAHPLVPDESGARRGVVASDPGPGLALPEQPSPLPLELLGAPVDDRLMRVIRWWARAIAAEDPVDSLIALNNALDMLTGSLEGVPDQVRRCPSCGHELTRKPGLRERTIYFLTEKAGCDRATADAIYQHRIELTHGSSRLTHSDMLQMNDHAVQLARIIRAEVGSQLGIDLPVLNYDWRIAPEGMFLVVESQGQPPPSLAEECGYR